VPTAFRSMPDPVIRFLAPQFPRRTTGKPGASRNRLMFKELANLLIGEVHQLAKTVQAVVVEDRQRSRLSVVGRTTALKRFLLIFNDLIFDPRVDRFWRPRRRVRTPGRCFPATIASLADFSLEGSRLKRSGPRLGPTKGSVRRTNVIVLNFPFAAAEIIAERQDRV